MKADKKPKPITTNIQEVHEQEKSGFPDLESVVKIVVLCREIGAKQVEEIAGSIQERDLL
jgi:hypothetical protein